MDSPSGQGVGSPSQCVQLEGVGSGAGALLPLDPAVALVGPHAVLAEQERVQHSHDREQILLVLILKHLVAIVVVLDGVGYPSEVLDTVRGGSIYCVY